jgi:DNA recombination protein RmuC
VSNTDLLYLAAGLAGALLLVVGILLGALVRAGRRSSAVSLPPGAEALGPAFTELRTQLSAVQNQVAQLNMLPAQQSQLQGQVADALRDLSEIRQVQAGDRQHWSRADEGFATLQRLKSTLLGSSTAGATGENVVEAMLASLPPQWRINNYKVGGKVVEFAIKLPDDLVLPIDSKVVAQQELDALASEGDPGKRRALEQVIQQKVLKKAEEVRKYVDDHSVGFAIAAISDAAYNCAGSVLSQAYHQHRALLVPYSLLGPFVLMVYEQHQHVGNLDVARLTGLLASAHHHLNKALSTINGSLSGAMTQLTNAQDDVKGELSAAANAVTQMRSSPDQERETA